MAQGDTPITIVGNLVADPELRFTASSIPVASFRVASTPRFYNRDTGQWEDGEGLFLTCNVWRQYAENVAESLSKGMRVVVNGRLRQRSYQTREGENRTVYEIEVDEVGPSLKYATAQVTRNPREGGGGYGGGFGGGQNRSGGRGGAPQGGFGQAPQGGFGGGNQPQPSGQNPGGQSNQGQDNDPWNSAPPVGGQFGGGDDDPPF